MGGPDHSPAALETLTTHTQAKPVRTCIMKISNPKEERQLRNLRRVQIGLFILIWGTAVVAWFFVFKQLLCR
jgi:hypothetical protein